MLWKSPAVGCVLVGQRVGGWAPPPPSQAAAAVFDSSFLTLALLRLSICLSASCSAFLDFDWPQRSPSGTKEAPPPPLGTGTAKGCKSQQVVRVGGALKNVLLLQCKMEDNDLMGRWIRTRPTTITHICNSINGWRQETQVVRKPCPKNKNEILYFFFFFWKSHPSRPGVFKFESDR